MKYIYILLLTIFTFSQGYSQTEWNGDLTTVYDGTVDPPVLNVFIKISFDQPGELADSNIELQYDSEHLTTPVIISTPLSSFSGYTTISLTEPQAETVSFNVSTDFSGNNLFPVTDDISMLDEIAHIQFEVIENAPEITELDFNAANTVVFDDSFTLLTFDQVEGESAVLPIELYSFAVENINDNAVLTWISTQESNSSHFEVERSVDGNTFSPINRTEAQGISTLATNYEFTDEIARRVIASSVDNFYYRLKMVDLDGSFEYSETRVFRLDKENIEISIFPNPTVNTVKVISSEEINEINVFDLRGQKIASNLTGSIVNLERFENGTYLIQIITDTNIVNKQVIKN